MRDDDAHVNLVLTRQEMTDLVSFTYEAMQLVDDWEFQTRTGATKVEALDLARRLEAVLAADPRDEASDAR